MQAIVARYEKVGVVIESAQDFRVTGAIVYLGGGISSLTDTKIKSLHELRKLKPRQYDKPLNVNFRSKIAKTDKILQRVNTQFPGSATTPQT